MRYGLFFKDTSFSVPQKEITKSDFLLGEITTLEKVITRGLADPSQCIPVVSAFLGAKKLSIKKEEIQYIKTLPVKAMLYCFDIKNIKFGLFNKFQEEIDTLIAENNQMSIIIYLPIGYFQPPELAKTLEFLSQKPFDLMVFLEDKSDLLPKTCHSLSGIFPFFEAKRVQCLFSNWEEAVRIALTIETMGIQKIAYFK